MLIKEPLVVNLKCVPLNHWGQVMHICIGNLTIISLDNGLLPGCCQAIIRTIAGILLIGPLGTNFSGVLIKIHIFSFSKMHLKMCPFCLSLNVLNNTFVCQTITWTNTGLLAFKNKVQWNLLQNTNIFLQTNGYEQVSCQQNNDHFQQLWTVKAKNVSKTRSSITCSISSPIATWGCGCELKCVNLKHNLGIDIWSMP